MPREFAIQRAAFAFSAEFRCPPAIVARAPGRVNLIGEHLDYNAGHVLPFAIHLDCVVAIGPSTSNTCRILALDSPDTAQVSTPPVNSLALPLETLRTAPADSLRALASPHHWSAYVLGVLFHLRPLLTSPLPAFNLTIATDVPLGGGLSSSASLEVALARALLAFTNSPWDPLHAALACQRAEHEFANVPCGLMDQLTSSAATADHALRIDCSFRKPPEHIPMPGEREAALLVIDSGVRHALATSEFADRVATCKSAAAKLNLPNLADLPPAQLASSARYLTDPELRAARHVCTEQHRVQLAVAALRDADFQRLGQRMLDSHASLRDDFRVSCPELDLIVNSAMRVPGVFGARMTGGGFGGCAIALTHPSAIADLQHQLRLAFQATFNRGPRSFATSAHVGASLVASMP